MKDNGDAMSELLYQNTFGIKIVREDYKNQVFEIITKIDLNNYETIPEFMDVISHPGKMIRSTFTYITSLLEKEQLDLNISLFVISTKFSMTK